MLFVCKYGTVLNQWSKIRTKGQLRKKDNEIGKWSQNKTLVRIIVEQQQKVFKNICNYAAQNTQNLVFQKDYKIY